MIMKSVPQTVRSWSSSFALPLKNHGEKIMGISEKGHVFFLADCQLPISLLTEKVVVGKCLPCFLVI